MRKEQQQAGAASDRSSYRLEQQKAVAAAGRRSRWQEQQQAGTAADRSRSSNKQGEQAEEQQRQAGTAAEQTGAAAAASRGSRPRSSSWQKKYSYSPWVKCQVSFYSVTPLIKFIFMRTRRYLHLVVDYESGINIYCHIFCIFITRSSTQ
jgi:hypothetical protein